MKKTYIKASIAEDEGMEDIIDYYEEEFDDAASNMHDYFNRLRDELLENDEYKDAIKALKDAIKDMSKKIDECKAEIEEIYEEYE